MKKIPCWTIMNCTNPHCIARDHQAQECWEIARNSEDHRPEFNICSDCLVHVLNTGGMPFTPREMRTLGSTRACVLGR
jgi:hypothetical protein